MRAYTLLTEPVKGGFPIGDLFIIIPFLLAGAQICQLFENDLMATCKVKRNKLRYDSEDLIC